MRAIVQHRYGSVDDLELREIDRPPMADGEVLVRVHAASVHPDVWHVVTGYPRVLRVMGGGLRRPKQPVPGTDMAGVVESAGVRFKPGDEVFGETVKGHTWRNGGAYAEYVSVPEALLAPKPAGLTFEQAAAVPTAGMTALQGIRDRGAVAAGERVLVNGAGGGVGSFAVQIAKALGAHVTAVTSGKNVEMLRSIGADEMVDYTRDDFTRGAARYDLILDVGGNARLSAMRRVLTPKGRIVMVAPQPGQWIGPIARIAGAVITSRLGSRPAGAFLADVSRDDLLTLKELIEDGKVRPVIDRTYRFEQIPDGIRYMESGAAAGKVVVTV